MGRRGALATGKDFGEDGRLGDQARQAGRCCSTSGPPRRWRDGLEGRDLTVASVEAKPLHPQAGRSVHHLDAATGGGS
ncbi:MAG: hypothetical protein R2716_01945 [Microthrixaceae bacterium]